MSTADARSTQASAGRRILVVDDSADLAETLAMVLVDSGHEVEIAYDGTAAIEKARAFFPEIVFLDIGLPGMNGYDVARALRAEQGDRKMVLIALSGYGEEEDAERSLASGFDRHILKPIDIDTLQGFIDEVC